MVAPHNILHSVSGHYSGLRRMRVLLSKFVLFFISAYGWCVLFAFKSSLSASASKARLSDISEKQCHLHLAELYALSGIRRFTSA